MKYDDNLPMMMQGMGMMGIKNPLENLPEVKGGLIGNWFTNNKLEQIRDGQKLREEIVTSRVAEARAMFDGMELMATAGHRMKLAFKKLEHEEKMMDLEQKLQEAIVAKETMIAQQLAMDLRRSQLEYEIFEKKLKEQG